MNALDGILNVIKSLSLRVSRLEAQEHNHPVINASASTELTIAGGIITKTRSYHTVDTQDDDPTDDLDTINGASDGDILVLRAADSARTVVVKNGTGNIYTEGDCTLDNAGDTITLIAWTTSWVELARSNNGA